jgi:hypothetical protein
MARMFFSSKRLVLMSADLLALTGEAMPPAGLGHPLATNAAGQSVWLVSEAELKNLRQGLRTMPGVSHLGGPRVQTYDGGQAQVFQGSTVSLGSNLVPVGLAMGVLPKIEGESFRLLATAVSSESFTNAGAGRVGIRTNFAAACRALVGNGGAVVLAGGRATGGNGTNYAFIISVTAVDGKGKPISLGR